MTAHKSLLTPVTEDPMPPSGLHTWDAQTCMQLKQSYTNNNTFSNNNFKVIIKEGVRGLIKLPFGVVVIYHIILWNIFNPQAEKEKIPQIHQGRWMGRQSNINWWSSWLSNSVAEISSNKISNTVYFTFKKTRSKDSVSKKQSHYNLSV